MSILPPGADNGQDPGHTAPCEGCGCRIAAANVGLHRGGHVYAVRALCTHQAAGWVRVIHGESDPCRCVDCDDDAWSTVWTVENHVVRGRPVAAIRALSTPALPSVRFVGLVDGSWPLQHAEMDRRGGSW